MEFTIEKGRLFMLQTRNGKRTAQAALKIAVDLVDEGKISKEEAVMLVPPEQLDQVLHPQFDAKQKPAAITKGVDASPGAAAGKVVFLAADAEEWAARGERVVLVRHETSPEDIRGMAAAQGILTSFGGKTSHAAVVGRQMGKPCVVGCGTIDISYEKKQFSVDDTVIKEGDFISIDGGTGEVMLGDVALGESVVIRGLRGEKASQEDPMYTYFTRLMEWADEIRALGVRTNADTPEDSELAIALGAEGIGLCRTEHMFFGEGKIGPMREMIVAENETERRAALAKLLPLQREDFAGIFRAMGNRAVTIRTLDPPLHEFLPHDEAGIRDLAQATGKSVEVIKARIADLHESNPMLGHRGCRLGVTYPEITEMQARAILEAAVQVNKEGVKTEPEIMIPLIGTKKELDLQVAIVRAAAEKVMAETKSKLKYMVGTMIEIPRAAITAAKVAETAEFFSFGTNDLTQTTFGLSRDDVPKVLASYLDKEIYSVDPFVSIDREGVGFLMKHAVAGGRSVRKDLKCGICGEHGGDPASVEFCHEIGLNYVSCSPYRLPIARLAAAQAVLRK